MLKAQVKNWKTFQHYKDRSPPWIKLHRALLDDFSYSSLPLASKALAPLIWLLAADSEDGTFNAEPEWLAFRLRWSEKDVKAGLSPLFEKGLLLPASGSLAECLQVATPETERETEREKPLAQQAARFDEFWSVYPVKKGRADAVKKWKLWNLDQIADQIIDDVKARKRDDRQWLRDGGAFIPHGSTYVNKRGWEDAIDATNLRSVGNEPWAGAL
jgi:hypothetical protein